MNKQLKKDGGRGIEWTDYTWNPVGGCSHGCRWRMPDGSIAVCYAETVAERLNRTAYPQGFAQHYWRPDQLTDPMGLEKPAKIFLDSMSDLMGRQVPTEQIEAVIGTCVAARRHTFQLLTKNAPRLTQFAFPNNVWLGVSAPFMFDHELTLDQQRSMVFKQLDVLSSFPRHVRWMSVEPLSFDIADVFEHWIRSREHASLFPLQWVVIGAATNGGKVYQPERAWVQRLLDLCDARGIKVFFKGNLEWSPWREEFPA